MKKKSDFILEIATSDYATTQAAVEGGADRIELCANLMEGGTTPSYGTIIACRESFDVKLYPIIRPRGGDFLYTDEEFEIMRKDIITCKQIGCDGVVIGMLLSNGAIDKKGCATLVKQAYPLGVTFHRAFDRCKNPFQALEDIIDIGCERILTSGLHPNAIDGLSLIKELNDKAKGKVIIMPGSGVRKENIIAIKEATGCKEFHTSLRRKTPSKMDYKNPNFYNNEESGLNNFIDSNEVAALKQLLNASF